MKQGTFVTTCLALLVVLFVVPSFGQTITTGAVSANNLCPGDTVYVPFTTTGTFQQKNAFTAQLSNSSGNFDSAFVTLGTTKDTTATYVLGIIPNNTGSGSHYRIRVISGRPYIIGSDNGSDISIGALPHVNFWAHITDALVGDTVTFSNSSSGGATYLWNFGDGATPATSTDSNPGPVIYSSPGAKAVSLTVTSSAGCSATSVLSTMKYREGLLVFSCDPAIPNDAYIDSVTEFPENGAGGNNIWVVPGGVYIPSGGGNIAYVEAGASVENGGGGGNVFYLKAGSTYSGTGGGGAILIYEDGAGITNAAQTLSFKCSSINFDYTNAPPYKFPTLGVNERATAPMNISLYPNPANDMLHVFTGATMPTAVRLFNTLGEEVWSAAGHVTNNVQVPTDNLLNGVYYLQVTAPGKMSTEKVTVIH